MTNTVVIIPHGISPSGFGVVQYEGTHNLSTGSAGNLQATSPCCGKFMDWTKDDNHICLNCQGSVDPEIAKSWNISHYVDVSYNGIEEWVLGILGFTKDEAEVELEWSS